MALLCAARAQTPPPAPPSKPQRPILRPTSNCLAPEYPKAALRAEAEGTTQVIFTIEPDGSVSNTGLARKSGSTKAHEVLDLAALQSVGRCNFGAAPGYEPIRAAQDFVWRLVSEPPPPASGSQR